MISCSVEALKELFPLNVNGIQSCIYLMKDQMSGSTEVDFCAFPEVAYTIPFTIPHTNPCRLC